MVAEMYARDVEDAASRLRELRLTEWEDLILAGLALAGAVVATQIWPELAIPLFLGGGVVGALGVRAIWRRWDGVDRLAGEHDAYVIPEIHAYARREATIERRRSFAAMIRGTAPAPGHPNEPRLAAVAEDLEALAAELEDEDLAFDPASAVDCFRLLTEVEGNLLYSHEGSVDELRGRIRHIRTGFSARSVAA
jgi:hypothetical protein